jgi:hypothetical protein
MSSDLSGDAAKRELSFAHQAQISVPIFRQLSARTALHAYAAELDLIGWTSSLPAASLVSIFFGC